MLPLILAQVAGDLYNGPCRPATFCGKPQPVPNGGLCLGRAWVAVGPGERATYDIGPDFGIYHIYLGDGRVIDVFAGGVAPAAPTRGEPGLPVLATRDGETIRRAADQGSSPAYRAAGFIFYGSAFGGGPRDAPVFDCVRFGKAAARLCGSASTTEGKQ